MSIEEQIQQLVADLRQKIADHGFAIACVFGEENTPPFGYTIGLSTKGLAEIFIAGVPPEAIHGILNDVGRRALEGKIALTPREPMDGLIDQFMAALMPVKSEMKTKTLRLVEPVLDPAPDNWEAVQLVWPDTEGRFPWSEEVSDLARLAQDFGLYSPPALH